MNRLDGLEQLLRQHTILLTPHQFVPETTTQAIVHNEQCSLRNGVYNLGFLAVRMTGQGRQFIDWWAERLRSYCYDEVENGLFTDQRWVDLAPAFFDDIAIVREPQYNVATWNLTHRARPGTRLMTSRSTASHWSFIISPGLTVVPRRRCSIFTAITAPYSMSFVTGISRGAKNWDSPPWEKSTASTTLSLMASPSPARGAFCIEVETT